MRRSYAEPRGVLPRAVTEALFARESLLLGQDLQASQNQKKQKFSASKTRFHCLPQGRGIKSLAIAALEPGPTSLAQNPFEFFWRLAWRSTNKNYTNSWAKE